MKKRKYTKIQRLLPIIEVKRAAGKIHSEIEGELGLEGDRPIHNQLKHERQKAAQGGSETARTETGKDTSGVQVRE